MPFIPDLKFILDNQLPDYCSERMYELKPHIKIVIDYKHINTIIGIQKVGGISWKCIDEFGTMYTISKQHYMFQSALYYTIKSMNDNRYQPKESTNINLIK